MKLTILGFTVQMEILIMIGIVYLIMTAHTLCGCCNTSLLDGFQRLKTEGFASMKGTKNTTQYDLSDSGAVDTSAWGAPNMTVSPGDPISDGVQNVLNRPQQTLPLEEGTLAMFSKTEFKPDCCPNTYSTSSGCACMTSNQYNYLQNRAGNNVPFSAF